MMQTYFSVVGYGNSGKTTLIRKLVEEFRSRGYKIAVVKHDPREHGTVDKKGSDTSLFWEAGSEAVILASPSRLTLFKRTAADLPLEEILPLCGAVDCVILEGFKGRPYPRVILWSDKGGPELPGATVLAIVYKKEDEQKVRRENQGRQAPLISRDDITELADHLERTLLLGSAM
jgi:molybdopterin-guanine dinucleotide biosynthesis protein MobB